MESPDKDELGQLSDQEKPKKKGRPYIAEEERRKNIIKVMANDAEQEALQQAADAAGLPISTWVRVAALEKARKGGA